MDLSSNWGMYGVAMVRASYSGLALADGLSGSSFGQNPQKLRKYIKRLISII
jgi:hypothetical protein